MAAVIVSIALTRPKQPWRSPCVAADSCQLKSLLCESSLVTKVRPSISSCAIRVCRFEAPGVHTERLDRENKLVVRVRDHAMVRYEHMKTMFHWTGGSPALVEDSFNTFL